MSEAKPNEKSLLEITGIELERQRVRGFKTVNALRLRNMHPENFKSFVERCCEEIILNIEGLIFTHNFRVYEIKYPQNWKEAFKERWFPKVILKRFPVKYKVHEINIKAIYPEYNIPYPLQKEKHFLHYAEEIKENVE